MKKFRKGCLTTFISILLFVLIILALLVVFRIPIADYIIEKAGSKIAGAKVEVDGVYLKPLKLHITWDRLQFTDKNNTWQNLFETGQCEFELAFKPLLAGKVLIDKMQVEDVRFDTERKTDGAISEIEKKPAKPSKLILALKANLEREKSRIPIFEPEFLKTSIDVNSLLKEFDFQTPAKADSIIDLAEDRYAYWENLIENNDYEKQVRDLETKIKSIDTDKMNNLIEIEQNLRLALDSYNTTIELYDDFNSNKTQLEEDLVRLKTLYKDVPDWIRSDYDNALRLAKLPDVSVQKIALMLFGDRVTDGIMIVLDKIEKSRQLAKMEGKEEKKDRMPHLPDFWIKEISLSAYPDNDLLVRGKILDISSDQKKTGKPIDILLEGEDDKIGNLKIKGLFDHRTDDSQEIINLLVSDMPVRNMDLANFDLLPKKLEKGNAKLFSNINLTNDVININLGFEASDIQFDYNSQTDMDERLVRVSRTITEAIDEITFDAGATQKEGNFSFSLSSNLDELISAQLKKIVQNEINRAKDEIKSEVNKELDKYKDQAETYINGKNIELQSKLNDLNAEINKQKAKIDAKKKEMEDKFEAEKEKLENEAGEKLGEGLEELFKKF